MNHIIYNIFNRVDFHEEIERNVTYGYCLLYDTIESVSELTHSLLPDIHFNLNDNAYEYIWKPNNYVYKVIDRENKRIKACFGFSESKNEKIVLGSNWMNEHHIIFDIEKEQIGFSESICNESSTNSSAIKQSGIKQQSQHDYQTLIKQREEVQKDKSNLSEEERIQLQYKKTQQSFFIVICVFITVIVILFVIICKLYKGNSEKKEGTVEMKKKRNSSQIENATNTNNTINEFSKLKNTKDFEFGF